MVDEIPSITILEKVCKVCLIVKQSRNSFKSSLPMRDTCLLDVVYYDICGQFEVPSVEGNKYFISFVNEFSIMMSIYLIKAKYEAFDIFQRFKVIAKKQCGKSIKVLWTNRGREYKSKEFDELCTRNGIQVTTPYTPQHNGLAKRRNRKMLNVVRSMLKEKALP